MTNTDKITKPFAEARDSSPNEEMVSLILIKDGCIGLIAKTIGFNEYGFAGNNKINTSSSSGGRSLVRHNNWDFVKMPLSEFFANGKFHVSVRALDILQEKCGIAVSADEENMELISASGRKFVILPVEKMPLYKYPQQTGSDFFQFRAMTIEELNRLNPKDNNVGAILSIMEEECCPAGKILGQSLNPT